MIQNSVCNKWFKWHQDSSGMECLSVWRMSEHETAVIIIHNSAVAVVAVACFLVPAWSDNLITWLNFLDFPWSKFTVCSSSLSAFAFQPGLCVSAMDGSDWEVYDPSRLRTCGWCGWQGEKFKKCSGCKGVHYCSVVCQKSDWFRHQMHCKPNKRVKATKATVGDDSNDKDQWARHPGMFRFVGRQQWFEITEPCEEKNVTKKICVTIQWLYHGCLQQRMMVVFDAYAFMVCVCVCVCACVCVCVGVLR